EESDELRRITAELAAAYPEYVRQTDAAGNALSFYTGRLRDATRAEWELYRIQQLRTLGRLVGGIESGRRRAERAARVAGMHFAEFEAQGGFAAAGRGDPDATVALERFERTTRAARDASDAVRENEAQIRSLFEQFQRAGDSEGIAEL